MAVGVPMLQVAADNRSQAAAMLRLLLCPLGLLLRRSRSLGLKLGLLANIARPPAAVAQQEPQQRGAQDGGYHDAGRGAGAQPAGGLGRRGLGGRLGDANLQLAHIARGVGRRVGRHKSAGGGLRGAACSAAALTGVAGRQAGVPGIHDTPGAPHAGLHCPTPPDACTPAHRPVTLQAETDQLPAWSGTALPLHADASVSGSSSDCST